MIRIGHSQDIHRLEVNGRPLRVGGVELCFQKGPVSHSDGDVVYHAFAEAILGALALGDLGMHFSDQAEENKNLDSAVIVHYCVALAHQKGFKLSNADITIVVEKPKLRDYLLLMRENVARLANVSIDQISVKAQTNEQVDAVGKEQAIVAIATVLLESVN